MVSKRGYIVIEKTKADEETLMSAVLDAGADDFLAKPFSFVVLLARLRALVRRAAGERPTVLEVGDLRLDPALHRHFDLPAER